MVVILEASMRKGSYKLGRLRQFEMASEKRVTGKTTRQLAKEYGVSVTTARRSLQRTTGADVAAKSLLPISREILVAERTEGFSLRELSLRHGVSVKTIQRRLRNEDGLD